MAEAPGQPPRDERSAFPVAETSETTGLSADELCELRHEVGNALTAALGYAEYLLRWRYNRFEEPDQRALLTIRDSMRSARSLLNPRANRLMQQPRDLRDIVHAAVAQLPPERAADVRVEVVGNAPLVGH